MKVYTRKNLTRILLKAMWVVPFKIVTIFPVTLIVLMITAVDEDAAYAFGGKWERIGMEDEQ